MHDWAEVHRLFHREDWSKTEIAEKLGMSRNTVNRLLGLKEPPSYERRPAGSKLDAHRGSIAQMLGDDSKVAATVILERLRRDGYGGGITILKDYLAEVRPLFVEAQSYQRTSYLPGEICQTDWWELGIRVPVGKGVTREVFGLVTTLPHSAAHAAVFCFSQQMFDFLAAFSQTLGRFGGVPEKVVVDRDSSIVVPRSRPARLHPEVAALFGAVRTKGVILPARSPESKGQVERTIGYLETSFLPLRSFEDISDLQAQHDLWAREVAYQRHHRRVGAKVANAFWVERGFLHPLPNPLPDTDRRIEVRVTKDGFCRVGDVDYSVPPGFGGRRLSVQSSWEQVVIFSEGKEIARHRRSFVPADVVLSGEHARALRLAREAKSRLGAADQEIPEVDLSRYDALIGVGR
ncbi:MAG: IS21 family transposase [Actinobacteria bacterium]|nr:IS21 family transposase [Actinomycetota bacterium]